MTQTNIDELRWMWERAGEQSLRDVLRSTIEFLDDIGNQDIDYDRIEAAQMLQYLVEVKTNNTRGNIR